MYAIVIDPYDLDTGVISGPLFYNSNEVIIYLNNHPELQNYIIITL